MKKGKDNFKQLRLGVKWKILIPVVIVNILVCATMGIFLGSRMKTTATQLAAEQALMAAHSAAASMDPAFLKELKQGDETTEAYQQAAAALDAARESAGAIFAYTLTTDGYYVYYGVEATQEERIGSVFEENYDALEDAFLGEEILDNTIYYTDDGVLISCYVPIFDEDGSVISIMGCDYDAQEIANKNRTNTVMVVFCTLVGLVLLGAVSIINLNRVLRPLDGATQIAAKIRACDLSETEGIVYSNDEIGELTRSFVVVSDGLREIINDISYQLGEMSRGNYRVESSCPERYQGTYAEILEALRGIRGELNDTILQIATATSQVNDGTMQIAIGAQKLSSDNAEQAASVEEISSSIELIADEVNATAQGAREAVSLSHEAGVRVEESGRYMKAFAETMQEINDKSAQISNIIQTIDSIAFQTNLLALNAAVEAARAGEAGKGFSVVADEVRMLAQKSAEAAKNTGTLIEGTTAAISHSLEFAQQTEDALKKVADSSAKAEDKVREIFEACNRQASNAEQINQNVSQIASVVQANSALAQETAATCEELSAQTQSMDGLMRRFQVKRQDLFDDYDDYDEDDEF